MNVRPQSQALTALLFLFLLPLLLRLLRSLLFAQALKRIGGGLDQLRIDTGLRGFALPGGTMCGDPLALCIPTNPASTMRSR